MKAKVIAQLLNDPVGLDTTVYDVGDGITISQQGGTVFLSYDQWRKLPDLSGDIDIAGQD